MRGKWLISILILSVSINAVVLANLGYHYYAGIRFAPSDSYPMSHRNHHFYQTLGLSEPQLAKMEPLAQAFHSQIEQLTAVMGEKKGLLVDLLSQKEVDNNAIEELRKEMAVLQEQIQKEVIRHILESKKIFDAKQQQKFFELLRQSMARREEGLFFQKKGAENAK